MGEEAEESQGEEKAGEENADEEKAVEENALESSEGEDEPSRAKFGSASNCASDVTFLAADDEATKFEEEGRGELDASRL